MDGDVDGGGLFKEEGTERKRKEEEERKGVERGENRKREGGDASVEIARGVGLGR